MICSVEVTHLDATPYEICYHGDGCVSESRPHNMLSSQRVMRNTYVDYNDKLERLPHRMIYHMRVPTYDYMRDLSICDAAKYFLISE